MTEIAQFKAKFQRLLELRQERDIDKKKAEKSEKEYREVEAELYEELADAGIRGRLEFDFGPDLGTAKFQRRVTLYGRVVDRETALESLKAEGMDDVIYTEAVREGRLNEFVRDRLENHQDLPEGIDFYKREGITISRK